MSDPRDRPSASTRFPEGIRAWRVAVGCAIGLMVAFGPAVIATFGLYLKPLSDEFGWSRTQVAVIYSIVSIVGAAGTPFLGVLLDRYGSRPVLAGAVLLLPVVLAVLIVLPASYPLFLTWGFVLGLVAIVTSPTAYVALIPQWFDRRMGLAIAIAMTGSGLGQALFLVAHGALLERMAWREAWAIAAGMVALIGIPNMLLFLRDNPDIRTLRLTGRDTELPGVTVGVALRTHAFWCAVISFFLVMLVIGAMMTHLVPLLTDRGLGVERAASIAAFIGITSLVGRLATGLIIDRVGYGLLGAVIFPAQAIGCAILLLGGDGPWLYAAAAAIGVAYGVEADMLPFMLRRTFGMRSFGRLYGIGFGVVQIGPVIGPLVLGLSFDRLGSYSTGLAVLIVLSLVSAVLIFTASRLARSATGAAYRRAHFPGGQ